MYNSFLRIGREDCMDDAKFNALLARMKTCKVKELSFFSNFFHSVHKIELIEEFAEKFKTRIAPLHDIGVRVGINHLTTVGFFKQGLDMISDEAPFCECEVNTVVGSFCPSSEKTYAYIRKVYTTLAKTHPDFIYVDDDIKFNRDEYCYCENCINRFEKETGLFSKNGVAVTKENLLNLIKEKEDVKRTWIYFQSGLSTDIYALVERTVHEIDSGIELGIMVHSGPFMKSETEAWIAAIKGKLPNVRVRPGGGLYNDKTPEQLLDKVASVARQNRYWPASVNKIEAEVECFPCQALAKSNRFLTLEFINYIAVGCTGIAYSLFGGALLSNGVAGTEFDTRWNLISEMEDYQKTLVNILDGSSLEGIALYHGADTCDDISRKWERYACNPEAVLLSGVPITFDARNAKAYVITGQLANVLSNESIEKAFEKPVFLTGEAADILNKRGFEKYTGVKVVTKYDEDTIEYQIGGKINNTEFDVRDCKRDAVQAFWWFGNCEAYAIEMKNEGRYITSLKSYSGKERGYGMAETVNDFGQKVVVSGYSAMGYANSYLRKQQLREAFAYLTGGIDQVSSCHKILFFERTLKTGGACCILSNMYLDDVKEVTLRIKGEITGGFKYILDGEERESKTVYQGTVDGYNEYTIEKIPAYCVGYIIKK